MSFEVDIKDRPTVEVGLNGFCKCDAATRCPLGKVGTQARCSHDELRRGWCIVRYPAGFKFPKAPMRILIDGEA